MMSPQTSLPLVFLRKCHQRAVCSSALIRFSLLKSSCFFCSGAKVNAQNNNGDTPLHLASFRGHKEACLSLVRQGADHTILNNDGKSSHQEAQLKDINKIFEKKSGMQGKPESVLSVCFNVESPFMSIFVLVHNLQAPIWSLMKSTRPVAQNPATWIPLI